MLIHKLILIEVQNFVNLLAKEAKGKVTTRHMLPKLKEPTGEEMCIKTEAFQGVWFANFKSIFETDVATAVMRSDRLTMGGLPVPVRARKVFLLGFRWQLGEWGFPKCEIVATLPAHRWVQRLRSWHLFGTRRVGRPRQKLESNFHAYCGYANLGSRTETALDDVVWTSHLGFIGQSLPHVNSSCVHIVLG